MTAETGPDNDVNRPESRQELVEQLLSGRVPPADAETAPGSGIPDPARLRADIHHRDAWRRADDFIDRVATGRD